MITVYNIQITAHRESFSYLVAGGEVDGEKVPEEEPRHVVQDEAVQRQVEGRDPGLLLLYGRPGKRGRF